jgi:glutathione synthase/RimK-type ligase-like ATP-grasp enzyme
LIGLATCDGHPDLFPTDRWLVGALSDIGYEARPVVWDDDSTDWSGFEAVIIRNTWDYYKKIDQWIAWLTKLEDFNVQLINDSAIIRDNIDKSYLQKLDLAGIAIIESTFIAKGSSLEALLSTYIYDDMIIKPTISAGSYYTERFHKSQIKDIIKKYISLGQKYDLIIQPFLPEIITQGEISLVFFNHIFSHSIVKKPSEGDFRIQRQYGGIYDSYQPSDDLIKFGHTALTTLTTNAVYGRVDVIFLNGRPHIMEVELIEPDLYFDYHPLAKANYLTAIKQKLDTFSHIK